MTRILVWDDQNNGDLFEYFYQIQQLHLWSQNVREIIGYFWYNQRQRNRKCNIRLLYNHAIKFEQAAIFKLHSIPRCSNLSYDDKIREHE